MNQARGFEIAHLSVETDPSSVLNSLEIQFHLISRLKISHNTLNLPNENEKGIKPMRQVVVQLKIPKCKQFQ